MEEPKLDAADLYFIGLLKRMARDMVRGMLRGNDAQCFSTEQYQAVYRKQWPPPAGCDGLSLKNARSHLEEMPDIVREVKPDVWATTEG